jgi:hypothetical protein
VVETCNGLEGLAVYHQTAFGLVITDLKMPAMDGETMIQPCGVRRRRSRSLCSLARPWSDSTGCRLSACSPWYRTGQEVSAPLLP